MADTPIEELLKRQPGESDFSYHKRIITSKLDGTLSDIDYSELSEYVYGRPYSSEHARKCFYGSKHTLDLLEKTNQQEARSSGTSADIDQKIAELRIERQKFYDQRSAWTKTLRDRARQEELNDIITHAVANGELPTLHGSSPRGNMSEEEAGDTDLLVSLNDIHYGAKVHNYWCHYDTEECARMFEYYLRRVISIARTHKCRDCIVWANGDQISGSIHHSIQVTNQENVIQQIMGVSELIAQFLALLSDEFEHVYFVSVAGNHSRIDTKERALKDERLDDLVEWYLNARLSGIENITVGYGEKIDSTMYAMTVRGKVYVGVHGDYEASPANIQSLQTMVGKPVYAVLMGHRHHNQTDDVQGVRVLMAGSFLGMDDYCVQRRIVGRPEQMVCVCDDHGIVCHYDVPLAWSETWNE